MTEFDEAEWIKQVSGWGYDIKDCPNQTEAICFAAVQRQAASIVYIKNPSEKVQRLAVQKYGSTIKYITKPSDEIIEIAFNTFLEHGYSNEWLVKWFDIRNIPVPFHIRLAE